MGFSLLQPAVLFTKVIEELHSHGRVWLRLNAHNNGCTANVRLKLLRLMLFSAPHNDPSAAPFQPVQREQVQSEP